MRYFGGPYDGELCQIGRGQPVTNLEREIQRMFHGGEYQWDIARHTYVWKFERVTSS